MSDAHLTSTDIINIRANNLNLKDISIDDTRKITDPKINNQSPSNQSFVNNLSLNHMRSGSIKNVIFEKDYYECDDDLGSEYNIHDNDISIDDLDEDMKLNIIKKNHLLRKKDLQLVIKQYENLMNEKKLLDR